MNRPKAEQVVSRDVQRTPMSAKVDTPVLASNLNSSRPWTGSLMATGQPTVREWRQRYARRLWLTDFVIIFAVVYATQTIWVGNEHLVSDTELLPAIPYSIVSAALGFLWVLALGWADSRGERVIGFGATEYVRVVDANLRVFGAVAIVAFLLRVEVARGYLLLSLPAGIVALLLGRWLWRRWLLRQRRRGEYCARALLVGSEGTIADTAAELRRMPGAGYRVVGACLPAPNGEEVIPGTSIPILGDVEAVSKAMDATSADTVIVTSADDLPADKVKQISWGLEAGRQHLVIAPSIADVAGPRIHTRPVAGLPLIHVETPRFSRGQQLIKRAFDLVAATLGVIVLSPVLIVLALVVKLSSPGPVLFRQVRVGLRGREFEMLKFRSMVVNAEELLADLIDADRDAGNDVLFKLKDDPRVTRVGKLMRRSSLDELPQLFNVISGSMSLVGPRPPLPNEVEQYADHVHRRFLAKPGITGLWQVSGRSALSWEETVRLDLSYVENWSMLGDFGILLRTAKAVIAPGETAF